MIPKFRAWLKEENKMIEPSDILSISFKLCEMTPNYLHGFEKEKYDFYDLELMQSTGLKDKNGKEIFEGDILFGHAGEDFWEIVEFDIEEGKWIRRDIWYNSKLDLSEYNENMEIVGNIYENPELLEVTE